MKIVLILLLAQILASSESVQGFAPSESVHGFVLLNPFIAPATAGHRSPSKQKPNRHAVPNPVRTYNYPANHAIRRHRIERKPMYLSTLATSEHKGKMATKNRAVWSRCDPSRSDGSVSVRSRCDAARSAAAQKCVCIMYVLCIKNKCIIKIVNAPVRVERLMYRCIINLLNLQIMKIPKFTFQEVEQIIAHNESRINQLMREVSYLEMVNRLMQIDVDRSKNIENHVVE